MHCPRTNGRFGSEAVSRIAPNSRLSNDLKSLAFLASPPWILSRQSKCIIERPSGDFESNQTSRADITVGGCRLVPQTVGVSTAGLQDGAAAVDRPVTAIGRCAQQRLHGGFQSGLLSG